MRLVSQSKARASVSCARLSLPPFRAKFRNSSLKLCRQVSEVKGLWSTPTIENSSGSLPARTRL